MLKPVCAQRLANVGPQHDPLIKRIPETLVEDGVLGILAPPGDLEESASHHLQLAVNRQPCYR